jgi:hypothetical protein
MTRGSSSKTERFTRIQQVADYYEELAEMAPGDQPPKSAQMYHNWDIPANRAVAVVVCDAQYQRRVRCQALFNGSS